LMYQNIKTKEIKYIEEKKMKGGENKWY
jgi:hypothetical protein